MLKARGLCGRGHSSQEDRYGLIQHDVKCDAQRVGHMVSNLLGNALTHGDPTHPVTLNAATFASNNLRISVSNHGSPILAIAHEKLFDPFERGDKNGFRKGLGLGLHIASEIAKAHCGTLDVQSDNDVTCFTFEMSHGAAET